MAINDRGVTETGAQRRRLHVLEQFPDERLEAVVVQWERLRPSVFVQLRRDPSEPLQFPGLRPDVPGNAELARDRPLALDLPLHGFVDPASGRIFGREACNADILFSQRVFGLLQPEPDLVMPEPMLWECRSEALSGIGVADREGTSYGAPAEGEPSHTH